VKEKEAMNVETWCLATRQKYSKDEKWRSSRLRFFCLDCQIDVVEEEHYCMLRRPVWRQTGLGPYDGVLCLDCIERRIGRRLTLADFLVAQKCDEMAGGFTRGELMLPDNWEWCQRLRGRSRGSRVWRAAQRR
jgi:hypothetical protein